MQTFTKLIFNLSEEEKMEICSLNDCFMQLVKSVSLKGRPNEP